LKHRQSKNHKPRIVLFIASPIVVDTAELTKLAKKLKKEKVNVDIVNFGEEEANNAVLTEFIGTLGSLSHLVSVAAPGNLSDALFSSTMFQDEDGSTLPAGFGPGFQYGMEDDPELAMALRISMEESRLKQEADATKQKSGETTMDTDVGGGGGQLGSTEDDLLQQALALSLTQQDDTSSVSRPRDLSSMTEEEQLHYALQMSMAASATSGSISTESNEKPSSVDAEMKDVIKKNMKQSLNILILK
jgi:26S proteasome regulatory subunit N10